MVLNHPQLLACLQVHLQRHEMLSAHSSFGTSPQQSTNQKWMHLHLSMQSAKNSWDEPRSERERACPYNAHSKGAPWVCHDSTTARLGQIWHASNGHHLQVTCFQLVCFSTEADQKHLSSELIIHWLLQQSAALQALSLLTQSIQQLYYVKAAQTSSAACLPTTAMSTTGSQPLDL